VHGSVRSSSTRAIVREIPEMGGEADYTAAPGNILDIDELALETIQLELPPKLLCSEDCKGLCPKCGADLNEAQCACPPKERDPRFDILNKLL